MLFIGRTLAGIGALVLPVTLFPDWYEMRGKYPEGADIDRIGVDGWTAFEVVDLFLVLISVAVLIVIFGPVTTPRAVLPALGLAAAVLVGFELIDSPPEINFLAENSGFDVNLETGAWLALGAAFLILLGGLLEVLRARRVKRSRLAPCHRLISPPRA